MEDERTHPDILTENLAALKKANLITKALSNVTRQKVVSLLLKSGNLRVIDLCNELNVEQTVMSQHLSILRETKLVISRRTGKSVQYEVNFEFLQHIVGCAIDLSKR